MSEFRYSDLLRTLFPKGPIWAFKAFGHADQLVETIGEAKETIRAYLKSLAHVRAPSLTPILSDLEREYGITPVGALTEAERRSILAGYVYAKVGSGKDDLQARLHAAGFTDLFVHQNDPLVSPLYYVGGLWSAVCGYEDTVCGNQEAYCGQLGVGGYVLANGPVYEAGGALHEYELPVASETWPMVFFIGSEKTEALVGFVLFDDGDMEALDVSAWTAGGSASLDKSTTGALVFEGLQSLSVGSSALDFSKQDVSLDERYSLVEDAFVMFDSGNGIIQSRVLDSSGGGGESE